MQQPPAPARVHGNQWSELDVPALGSWTPARPVTVVMPYFQAQAAVEITLAALGEQTYPRHLLQVVIADDGSDPPLSHPKTPEGLDLQIVYQEDRGFGAPRARNAGVRAAEGEIIVFADCDMVPEPGWVEAHARWHHAASDVVTLGFRRHVGFDGITPDMVAGAARAGSLEPLFTGRTIERPEWIEFHMSRTADLTSSDDDLFRVVTSGNMSLGKNWFETLGGFDESFTQWGAEDTELGYRAFARGSVLAPDREALAWHQGLGTAPDDAETISLEQQRAKIAHLIAQRGFRRSVPGRSFTVPYAVVIVAVGDTPAATVTETVERILGSRFHDLVVELDVDAGHPHREWLSRQFQPDPRVNVGAGGSAVARWPYSALFVDIPPTALVRDYAIDHLVDMTAEHGVIEVPLADGTAVTAVWGRAMQRVHRLGGGVAEASELFGRLAVDWRDVGIRSQGSGAVAAGRGLAGQVRRTLNSPDSRVGKVWRQTKAVRSPGDAARVGRWFAGAIKQKVASRSMTSLPPVPKLAGGSASIRGVAHPTTDGALGVQLAIAGGAAERMFAVSERPVRVDGMLRRAIETAGGHLDVLVSADPVTEPLAKEAADLDIPVVTVGEPAPSRQRHLAAPDAIDSARSNPASWVYAPTERAVVVPTKARLTAPPPQGLAVVAEHDIEVPDGVAFRKVASLVDELRYVGHVVDREDFHHSNVERASLLVELSARGVPVLVPDLGADMHAMLGSELADVLQSPLTDRDLHGRELRSVRARRAALRDHSLRARTNQILELAGLRPNPLPAVSVILATNRPDYLDQIVRAVADQTYPSVELVLVLHGDSFGSDTAQHLLGSLDIPARVVTADASLRLGEVLNVGVEAASGDLIVKMDDDDFYDPEHIWDLVLAQQYSGAQLIGKGAEFVYLPQSDVTIRRFVGRSETYTTTIGGGALLIGRSDLASAGGWRRVATQVDRALVADVERAAGRVYRTHGFGYILNRHGVGHTWGEGDQYFLDQAEDQRPGFDPAFAGITL